MYLYTLEWFFLDDDIAVANVDLSQSTTSFVFDFFFFFSFSFFIVVIFFKEGTNAIHSEPQFHVARERLKETVDTAPVRGGFYYYFFY